jgi:hypothetical protein
MSTAAAEVAPKKVVGAATSKVVKSHAGAKVIVASKIPQAVELFLEMPVDKEQRFQGSIWVEKVFVQAPNTPRYVIAGTSYPVGAPPEGMVWPDKPRGAYGAAFTYNVDKDFWETWFALHRETEMVRNNLIAAFDDEASARAWAKEHEKADSGLEPISRATDSEGRLLDRRIQKRMSPFEARKLAQESTEPAAAAE